MIRTRNISEKAPEGTDYCLLTIRGHSNNVSGFAPFYDDQRERWMGVSCGLDSTARVWDLNTGTQERELTDPDMVLGSRVNTLRIERAAKQIRGTTVSPESFTDAQLTSLRKGFAIVNTSGDGAIPAFQLADVFAQFGAELGQEECLALLSAIDCTDETSLLTFDEFLVCMAVLVNA